MSPMVNLSVMILLIGSCPRAWQWRRDRGSCPRDLRGYRTIGYKQRPTASTASPPMRNVRNQLQMQTRFTLPIEIDPHPTPSYPSSVTCYWSPACHPWASDTRA